MDEACDDDELVPFSFGRSQDIVRAIGLMAASAAMEPYFEEADASTPWNHTPGLLAAAKVFEHSRALIAFIPRMWEIGHELAIWLSVRGVQMPIVLIPGHNLRSNVVQEGALSRADTEHSLSRNGLPPRDVPGP